MRRAGRVVVALLLALAGAYAFPVTGEWHSVPACVAGQVRDCVTHPGPETLPNGAPRMHCYTLEPDGTLREVKC